MTLCRIPQNNAVAMQWTKAIKKDETVERAIGGMVCIEHFLEKDFKRKDKYRIELKPEAVPSIFIDMSEYESHDANIECVDMKSESCCSECLEKDQLIAELKKDNENLEKSKNKQDEIIDHLRRTIKPLRDKVNYLEAVKVKLKEASLALKEQEILKDDLCQKLKVFTIYDCTF